MTMHQYEKSLELRKAAKSFGEHPPAPGCMRGAFPEAAESEGEEPENGGRKQEQEGLQR